MSSEEKKIHLLIVDDEVNFLETIAKRLRLKGFDVATASNGKDALKVAKKGKFDVAILDLKMPDMDGTEVLEVLKGRHKHLEAVMLTGHGTIDSAVACTKLGAFGYLEKPYDFDKLVDVLQQAYKARLMKKFRHDKQKKEQLEMLAMGSSPMAILKSLVRVDDDEK
jgi:DNA-binding NtrC family response regulator